MNKIIKFIVRFVLFQLIQVLILNEVPPIHQFIIPYIYFTFLIWMPFGTSRLTMTLLGFLSGLCLDMFTNTPGLHAAVAALVGFVRPTILNLLVAQEVSEDLNREPSVGTMGWGPYFIYVFFIIFVHHFYLVLLEWLQFGNFIYFIGKVTATSIMSLMIIFLTELVMNRRKLKR